MIADLPSPDQHVSIVIENDHVDDHRTAAWGVAVRALGMLALAEYDMLTEYATKTRTDVATVAVGYDDDEHWTLTLGARTSGNLGGSRAQQDLHDLLHVRSSRRTYDPRRTEPCAVIGWRSRFDEIEPSVRVVASPEHYDISVAARASVAPTMPSVTVGICAIGGRGPTERLAGAAESGPFATLTIPYGSASLALTAQTGNVHLTLTWSY